jgi:hypothetical protein
MDTGSSHSSHSRAESGRVARMRTLTCESRQSQEHRSDVRRHGNGRSGRAVNRSDLQIEIVFRDDFTVLLDPHAVL